MAFDIKALTRSFMDFECYRRFIVHNCLKDSKVYFGQPPILDYLLEHGSCTQNELAAALNVSPASMAVSVKRMQKSGLVQKVNDENDMRCNKITITDFGKKQIEDIHSRLDEIDTKTFSGFSEEELCSLKSYIDRINRNLSDGLPDKKSIFKMLKNSLIENGGEKDA